VAHHGEELLNPQLGVLQSRTIEEGVILEEDGLRVTAFEISHPPIEPAFGYRLDYAGRSVVFSRDTLVTEKIIEMSDGADVVLHDAMALQLVQAAENALRSAGITRLQRSYMIFRITMRLHRIYNVWWMRLISAN